MTSPLICCTRWLVAASIAVTLASPALAQPAPRVSTAFSINQTTTSGNSVFVLGDLPELGGNDVRRAVKLDPSTYPIWRATVSLPAGATGSYRFLTRLDSPAQAGISTNASFISPAPIPLTVASASPGVPTKTLLLTWDVASPKLWYRAIGSSGVASGPFTSRDMELWGPSLNQRPSDRVWLAWNFLPAAIAYELYFTDANGSARYPATGQYTTRLDAVWIQEGQQYTYVPSGIVSAPSRTYNPADASTIPTIQSSEMGETRRHRVFLPRGYAQHTSRRYPVVYMHDGQNVFDVGSFGSWNAEPTFRSLQESGRIRECIVVGMDSGPARLQDYLPPGDFLFGAARGDRYARYILNEVKPLIDGQYRTLTGRDHTTAIGSSMGGVVSLYLAWDFTSSFSRVGLFSGAWQTCPNFLTRVRATTGSPPRSVRMYMDSGDSGDGSSDNFWNTYGLRDFFVGGATSRYALESGVRHVVGFNQQHNEAAWASRLPGSLEFLIPATEDRNEILTSLFNPRADRNADGRIGIEDLYTQIFQPIDINLDGTTDSADADLIQRFVQRSQGGQ
ncbi:MAG: hypothetical protein K2X32_02365 [Phycisphaerales bacterium]|nr:hypothetical protein [Phycisphaerales bacterium]